MWIFTPGGLLMPAAVPADKADPKFTMDGKFDFQIRAREAEHLTNFFEFMEDGSYNPEIQLTPEMDYNARFYTTREAFAAAMSKAILAIDYEKFKPVAYDHGKKPSPYYDVLNSIWGTVTRLGTPGGKWGTYSGRNPNGYKPTFSPYSTGQKRSSYIPSTFGGLEEFDSSDPYQDLSWTPTVDDEIDEILSELQGIPADQWEDYLSEHEWKLVRSIAQARIRDASRRQRRQRGGRRAARNR